MSSSFHPLLTGEQDRTGRALIRMALDRGIRLFDCSAGRRTDAVERRWAAAESGAADSTIVIATTLVGEPSTSVETTPGALPAFSGAGGLFGLRVDDWAAEVRHSVERATTRLGRRPLDVGWIEGRDARALDESSVQQALRALCEDPGPVRRWGVRYDRRLPPTEEFDAVLATGPHLLGLPLHLLNGDPGLEMVARAHRAGVETVSTDPYASGLLDGSRLRLNAAALPGEAPLPTTLGRLSAEFKPVTQLAFLTKDRRRTLPHAALQFLWGTPGLASAVVPLREPGDLEVALGAFGATPLDATERNALNHPAAYGRAAPKDPSESTRA